MTPISASGQADNIPGLTIETNDDGLLTLQQDWCGNVDRVAVHPVHVRLMAERLGLIAQFRTQCGIEKSNAELQLDNDRLRRHHLRLREHMLSLQLDFAQHADHRHADLTTEMWRINSIVDMMDLVCADFEAGYGQEPCHATPGGVTLNVTPPCSPATPLVRSPTTPLTHYPRVTDGEPTGSSSATAPERDRPQAVQLELEA